jgi:hypothetical protein
VKFSAAMLSTTASSGITHPAEAAAAAAVMCAITVRYCAPLPVLDERSDSTRQQRNCFAAAAAAVGLQGSSRVGC